MTATPQRPRLAGAYIEWIAEPPREQTPAPPDRYTLVGPDTYVSDDTAVGRLETRQ